MMMCNQATRVIILAPVKHIGTYHITPSSAVEGFPSIQIKVNQHWVSERSQV